jgi:hypothetical protein|nr:MAG TPA: hypothetical protein [Caudoviricetes sp.]
MLEENHDLEKNHRRRKRVPMVLNPRYVHG